jgi:hypothetical protein
MRRPTLAPFILIGTLSFGSAAYAGCCDDPWSCFAAVATAGLSCQVQGLMDTVKTLNDTVSKLFKDLTTRTADIINDARQAVEQAASDIKAIREKAASDMDDAANRAHAIANPIVTAKASIAAAAPVGPNVAQRPVAPAAAGRTGVASVAAMPPAPADTKAILIALDQADKYVRDLKDKTAQVSKDGLNFETQALSAVARHVALAQKIALDAALQPLKMLGDSLLDLLQHPERIFDPSAQIDADLKRIGDEIPAMLDRIGNEVAQEATADLDQARGPVQQLQDQAEAATKIAQAMQALANSKTQNDLDALNKLLPAVSKQAVKATRGVVLPAGVVGRHELLTSAVGRLQVAKLPLIAKHRATVSSIASQWVQIKSRASTRVQLDAATTQKGNASYQQLLGNGTAADADKRKQKLLAEAQHRFAKDPKTLRKIQEYIRTH